MSKYENIPLFDIDKENELFSQVEELPSEKSIRSKATTLPREFLRKPVVPIIDQGEVGSCVGCSSKVVFTDHPDHKRRNYSAMWIYRMGQKHDEIKGEDYSGTTLSGACKAMRDYGVALEKYFPYRDQEGLEPPQEAYENAKYSKLESYYRVSNYSEDQLKKLVMEKPLLTAYIVHREFYNTDYKGFVDEERYFKTSKRGGHAVALVGWIEKNNKTYWAFQNSWGDDFGDDGYFYMSADFYKKISRGFYFMEHAEVEVPYDPSDNDLDDEITKRFNPISLIFKIVSQILGGFINIFKK